MNVTAAPSVPTIGDTTASPDAAVVGDVFAALLAAVAPAPAPVDAPVLDLGAFEPGCAFTVASAPTPLDTTCAFGAPGTVPTAVVPPSLPAIPEAGAPIDLGCAFGVDPIDPAPSPVATALAVSPAVEPDLSVPAPLITADAAVAPDVPTTGEQPIDREDPEIAGAAPAATPVAETVGVMPTPVPSAPSASASTPEPESISETTDHAAPTSSVADDTAALVPTSEPAVDATTAIVDPSTPRPRQVAGDVAPTSIGRLVAATVPQLRETNEVRLSVRLDPPTLGHVTVDISARDGAVHVVVRPTDAASNDVLAAQRSAVDAALASAGFELGGFDVRSDDRRDAPKPRVTAIGDVDEIDDAPPTTTSDDGALRL